VTDDSPAEELCARIEAHRDIRYRGGVVTDPLDAELYSVATWFRTWQDLAPGRTRHSPSATRRC
jgi:hypothetical protein